MRDKRCVYERCPFEGTYVKPHDDCGSQKLHCAWYKPPMTNLDKIRKLDDAHLGGFLRSITTCEVCPVPCNTKEYRSASCDEAWTNWLLTEVE